MLDAVSIHPLIAVAALVFMAVVAVSDIRERRISNRLNLSGLILGLSMQLLLVGTEGLTSGLAGFGVGLAILFVPFAAGMIGGGDVKFVAATGAFLGVRLVLIGLAAGMIIGGLSGAVALLRKRKMTSALRGLRADLVCIAHGVRPTALKSTDVVETIPYGVMLAAGLGGSLCFSIFF